MFDLQAGVHFQEIEALVLAGDELDGAGAVIVDGLGQGHGLGAHGLAGRLVEQGRRRLLDDLLVTPLDRAFALEQVDDVAMLVAEHLDLDVARAFDELLDEDAVVAEGALGLGADGGEAFLDVLAVPGDANALAAAAGRRLQHHRIADLLGDAHRMGRVVDLADVARHAGDASGGGELLALDLVAHRLDGVRVWTDEDDALVGAALGEVSALGQKAKARVHGLRAGFLAGGDDLVGHEVRLVRRRRADEHRFVGHLDRQAIGVSLGVDHHRLDAHAAGRLDDTDGDFATVGDQDFRKHQARLLQAYSRMRHNARREQVARLHPHEYR